MESVNPLKILDGVYKSIEEFWMEFLGVFKSIEDCSRVHSVLDASSLRSLAAYRSVSSQSTLLLARESSQDLATIFNTDY